MSTFNQLPNYNIPTTDGRFTNKSWYFFWQALFSGIPPADVQKIVVGVSPYQFQASVKGSLIINGGTISQVTFSRDGVNSVVTGQTQGIFPVNAGDYLTITYSAPPTLTFVPS